MSDHGYLRHPTLQGDTLVFVCDDDLWSIPLSAVLTTAPSSGADHHWQRFARRLTAGLGEPSFPALSADQRFVAYVGRDEQHPEVYLMPAQGGAARRLTWLGAEVVVRGFTAQGHVLFMSSYGQPFSRYYRAFSVDPAGGLPQLLPLGPVNHLSCAADGRCVIGRNTADPARWKRYRGGTAGQLWVDAQGDGQFVRLKLDGNVTSPMWIGERIYFLSDADGIGNLYSCRPDGSDLQRLTQHRDYYARQAQASADGRHIVYQCGAQLWLYQVDLAQTQCLDIRVPAHRTQAARRFVSAAEHLESYALHPAGHSLALEVRGKPFTMALWEGAVRQYGQADAVRYRYPQWSADGKHLIVVSDATGEERIEVFEIEQPIAEPQQLDWDVGHVVQMRAAPHGTLLAMTNHRHELLLGDIESGVLRRLDRSDCGRIEELAWSPDAAWLAYPFWTSPRTTAIKLAEVASGQTHLVTQAEFHDYSPAFDPEGKYLYFLSLRTFDPVYDSVQFELSFPRAARPYLIALQAHAAAPFEPQPRAMKHEDKEDSKDDAKEESSDEETEENKPKVVPLSIDLEGITQRVAAFPVSEERYGQIVGVKGRVLWTVFPIAGSQGGGGHREGPGHLEVFDFDKQHAETLLNDVEWVELSAQGNTLITQSDKHLRAIDPCQEIDKDSEEVSDEPSRESGWLDLNRIRVSIDPRAEWQQMLREVWRLQRDQFWVADMAGANWPEVYQRYQPLLARVATRAELSDLIWEMQGELATSHAYESGGDHRKPPALTLGLLAAELSLNQQGRYEITHIVRGDAWDACTDSPLNALGVQAQVGECIVAVNGQAVSTTCPPQALLVNQAKSKVELTLINAEGEQRCVLVNTLADEAPARYREWVEHNRQWVHKQSADRVGYLHLPDMMAAGFAEFHRYFAIECDYDGLIIDVRFNRGGHVSQLLLEKVARKRLGYDLQRWGRPAPYPLESPAGAVVALTNEHAGSDGDIFSHCFKLMQLGPLVGTRTWGGVIGIWPRHGLVDGSETTQPEFSFWFKDVGWAIENYGAVPDIEVNNAPQDAAGGYDRQLEKALEVTLRQIEQVGVLRPGF